MDNEVKQTVPRISHEQASQIARSLPKRFPDVAEGCLGMVAITAMSGGIYSVMYGEYAGEPVDPPSERIVNVFEEYANDNRYWLGAVSDLRDEDGNFQWFWLGHVYGDPQYREFPRCWVRSLDIYLVMLKNGRAIDVSLDLDDTDDPVPAGTPNC